MKQPLLVWVVNKDGKEVSQLESALTQIERYSQLLAFSGEAELLEYISFSDQIPDLILIDDKLPLLTPVELAQLLLASPFLQVAMVVLTSVHNRTVAEHQFARFGIKAFLEKPTQYAEWQEFARQLCEIARGSRSLRAPL